MRILIDILPAVGHFHATLQLACIMRKAGWNVSYSSLPAISDEVKRHGFDFKLMPDIPVVNVRLDRLMPEGQHLGDSFMNRKQKIRSIEEGVVHFRDTITGIAPDIVLLDEQWALKSFFYEAVGIPVIVFQTKPDTRQIQGIPPFTSHFLPTFTWLSNCICAILWEKALLKYHINRLYQKIFLFGYDNYSLLRKVLKENGIDIKNRIELRRSFRIGVKGIPRLILSPKAFDFPHGEKDGVYRLGPLFHINREETQIPVRYKLLKEQIENKIRAPARFLIYCSMGTITSDFRRKVKNFFLKVAEVARINPNVLIVISTGRDFDINELVPSPKNLYIFDKVPQLDLLRHCDLMITHGGMNSIIECIYNEVPMLVYPLSSRWDQPGNSARVLYHGLGLRGRINEDSPETISSKVNTLIAKKSLYQTNIRSMRLEFEEMNSSSSDVLRIIESEIRHTKYGLRFRSIGFSKKIN